VVAALSVSETSVREPERIGSRIQIRWVDETIRTDFYMFHV